METYLSLYKLYESNDISYKAFCDFLCYYCKRFKIRLCDDNCEIAKMKLYKLNQNYLKDYRRSYGRIFRFNK